MLSEDANERSINLAVRIGKFTGIEIKRAIEKMLAERKKRADPLNPTEKSRAKYGRTTLNQLQSETGSQSTLELSNPDLRLLNRTMKEHGVRFALTKDSKDKYTLFFKCDNIDNFSKAYERYAQKLTKRSKNDPSIKKSLHEARKTAQTLSAQRSKEKNRSRGGLER